MATLQEQVNLLVGLGYKRLAAQAKVAHDVVLLAMHKSGFKVISMESLLAGGEEAVWEVIGEFSCRYNPEIDNYLRNRSVDFTRKSMTISLVRAT